MKTTILKFLAFLEPEWMRVALHIYIGLSIGFNLIFKTGVTAFNSIVEQIVGAFFFTAIVTAVVSGFFEYLQSTVLEAKFSYKDILQSTIASVIAGLLCLLYPSSFIADVLWYSAIVLVSLEVIRLLIIKLWK